MGDEPPDFMCDSALIAEFIKQVTDPRLFNQLMSDDWGRGLLTGMVLAAVVKTISSEELEAQEDDE